MKVLIACEFSGIARDAFRALGHDAWSCDLLPSEIPGQHYQCDVREILDGNWDMMIAHPPCTHLAVSGARYFYRKQTEQAEALDFVRMLMDAPIPHICVENPVSIISTHIRKPDQIIQPWQFGHKEQKTTCLWLKGLPKLAHTEHARGNYRCKCGRVFDESLGKYGCAFCAGASGAARLLYENQTIGGQNKLSPSPERWRERSRTYPGIARAMASQWSEL